MEIETLKELAAAGSAGVAIALIIAVVWIIKLIIPIIRDMQNSIQANTKVTTEMYEFLKNLNGRLRKQIRKVK